MTTRAELANAIRVLSMDAVQKANSGHPGMPMGMADIATVLWQDFLQHYPNDPTWPNRDRFILSNGHGSMLLYSLLHLSGYDLSMDDIKQFRQLHSRTPGHPEYGMTPGVETSTGPLGQGLSNAVGMALAEKILAAHFNQPNFPLIDHYTYVFLGDGCLMEGVSHEVSSLAGTLGLGKLIAFWDDNGISIDGEVEGWFTDDTPKRFESYGWRVIKNIDGHDQEAVKAAIQSVHDHPSSQPTLICCKTIIGFGAPNLAGTEKTHGSALGVAEVAAVREHLNWQDEPFVMPERIYQAWRAPLARQQERYEQWQTLWQAYEKQYPTLAQEYHRRLMGTLPTDFLQVSHDFIEAQQQKAQKLATRQASQQALNAFAPHLPELLGGSADLTGSNLTNWQGTKAITGAEPDGNYIYYGVREFGMSAVMNGLALHSEFIPYGGTFLTFTDYARNAVRMAALMQKRVIFVYTHDSIGLGEDGPTHQPIEHLWMLRLTPNLSVWRPCDSVETAVAWQQALLRQKGPTCLAFSRQGVMHQPRNAAQMQQIEQGGYVLSDDPQFKVLLMATGSEVELIVKAAEQLRQQSIPVRVVSMPCVDIFLKQSAEYRAHVLPNNTVPRIIVEAGVTLPWQAFIGQKGEVLGIDRFGESAPASDIYQLLGLTVEHIIETANKWLK